jgi:hypothetical protein
VQGIAPELLFEQVRSTAAWALEGPAVGETSFRAVLRDRAAAEGSALGYFRALLAAHFCTVATFVPTDVDARIRHHAFTTMTADDLAAACDLIDEAARWDVHLVSARVVASNLSGHDGEWLAVRAGALGRSVALGADALASRLTTAIDAELDREHRILAALEREDPIAWLRAATTVAHNLGDLSRVAEALPGCERFARLGHERSARFGTVFVRAGAANKELLVADNHRFLALRKPRALRRSRDLLLPIGPFFDGWGRAIATHDALDENDRAEVVTALLSIHVAKPASRGCLRALAAMHASTARGLSAFEPRLPARMRKLVSSGPVRDALKVSEETFIARMRLAAERAIKPSFERAPAGDRMPSR